MSASAGSSGLAAPFARFLRWWGSELRALVPGPLARLLGLEPTFLLVEPATEGGFTLTLQDGPRRRQVGRLAPGQALPPSLAGRVVVLRLPAGEGLGKTIRLPLAAEENLREVLEFEMERQTPFPADRVHFDWHVLERRPEERRLTLRLLVAPRERVAQALAQLAGARLAPHALDLGGEAAAPLEFNLLPEEARAPMPRRRGERALAAVAALLALAALLSPLLHGWHANRRAEGEIALLRVQAEPAARLRAELDREQGGLAALARHRHGLRAVVLLEELTRLFPDEAWVQELALHGGELEISGMAESAASLVQRIESSPLFRGVDFRTAVTRDPASGQERFNFEIALAGRAGAP